MTTELERRDLEAQIRRKRRKLEQDLEHGTGPWLAGVWARAAAGGSALGSHGWGDARRERRRSLDDAVREAEAEISRYRGPGWIRRTLAMGGLMGLGVGVPVGLLIAFGFPPRNFHWEAPSCPWSDSWE